MNPAEIIAGIQFAASVTTPVEWVAFITAIIYVILASKERVECWFFGIISSGLSVYVFFNAKLYYESFLNVFYVIVGFYGWYEWMRKGKKKEQRKIVSYTKKEILPLIGMGIAGSVILGYLSSVFTESPRPYIDAMIASFSILATWMTARKIIENWILWIILDVTAGVLYFTTQLYLFSALYIVYAVLAVYGLMEWRKKKKVASEPLLQ